MDRFVYTNDYRQQLKNKYKIIYITKPIKYCFIQKLMFKIFQIFLIRLGPLIYINISVRLYKMPPIINALYGHIMKYVTLNDGRIKLNFYFFYFFGIDTFTLKKCNVIIT